MSAITSVPQRRCAGCQKLFHGSTRCPKCDAYFCGRQCYRQNWASHKKLHSTAKKAAAEQSETLETDHGEVPDSLGSLINHIIDQAKKGLLSLNECIAIPALGGDNPELHFTPLMHACQFKNYNKNFGTHLSSVDVKQLIEAGADVNAINPVSKINALFFAVKYTDVETLKMLIEANIDTTVRNNKNNNAFYNAVEMARDPEMLSCLLSNGFSVNDTLNFRGDLDFGERNAAEHMLVLTREALIGWKVLEPPSIEKFVRCFQLLLDAGCRIKDEHTILYIKITREGIKPREKRSFHGESIDLVETDPYRIAAVNAYFGSEFPIRRKPAKWLKNETQFQHQEGTLNENRRFQENMKVFYSKTLNRKKVFALSDMQCYAECQALHLNCDISTAKKVLSKYIRTINTRISSDRGSWRISTAATHHVIGPMVIKKSGDLQVGGFDKSEAKRLLNSGSSALHESPRYGPAMIHVTLPSVYGHSVPILASICTESSITVVPKALADQIGIAYTPLRNKEAIAGISGVVSGKHYLLQGITINLNENVQITLRTAVVIDTVDRLQFGSDFFNQAAFTMLDVFTGGGKDESITDRLIIGTRVAGKDGTFNKQKKFVGPSVSSSFRNKKKSSKCEMVSILGSSFGMQFTKAYCEKSSKEELRFYTKDDQIVILPIYHGYPGGCGAESYKLLLQTNAKMDQCNWCGRIFPGFMRCKICHDAGISAYYCSKVCQKHDWPKHKLTDSHAKCSEK